MKKLLLFLLVLLPAVSYAQLSDRAFGVTQLTAQETVAVSTPCTTPNACVVINVSNYGVVAVTVRGSFTGVTINFDFSDDGGVTWFQEQCTRTDAAIQEVSEAVPNNTARAWECGVAASTNFRVRQSAIASGSLGVGLTLTAASIEPAPTVSISTSSALPAGASILGKVGIDQTTDVTTNGVEIAPTAGSAAGITPISSTTTESSHILKASAGNFYGACVTTGASAGFMMVFNATSAPGDGAVTPVEWIQIAANSTQCLSYGSGPPNVYSTGITLVFSTTGPFTKTASATAAFVGRVK